MNNSELSFDEKEWEMKTPSCIAAVILGNATMVLLITLVQKAWFGGESERFVLFRFNSPDCLLFFRRCRRCFEQIPSNEII